MGNVISNVKYAINNVVTKITPMVDDIISKVNPNVANVVNTINTITGEVTIYVLRKIIIVVTHPYAINIYPYILFGFAGLNGYLFVSYMKSISKDFFRKEDALVVFSLGVAFTGYGYIILSLFFSSIIEIPQNWLAVLIPRMEQEEIWLQRE